MKEVILSDGRKAVIRDAKGRDLFEAMRLANEPGEISKLLLARVTLIDDKPITEDDLEELPLEDALALLDAFTERYPFSQMRRASSSSSEKASATQK